MAIGDKIYVTPQNTIASLFDASIIYNRGDIIFHDNKLYSRNANAIAAETWDDTKWTLIKSSDSFVKYNSDPEDAQNVLGGIALHSKSGDGISITKENLIDSMIHLGLKKDEETVFEFNGTPAADAIISGDYTFSFAKDILEFDPLSNLYLYLLRFYDKDDPTTKLYLKDLMSFSFDSGAAKGYGYTYMVGSNKHLGAMYLDKEFTDATGTHPKGFYNCKHTAGNYAAKFSLELEDVNLLDIGYGFTFGLEATNGGGDGIALGRKASATGKGAIALGESASAIGNNSIAIFAGSSSNGQESIAIGAGSTTYGSNSIAIGNGNTTGNVDFPALGSYAIARGVGSTARGNYSTAIGSGGVSAYGSSSIAIGSGATTGKLKTDTSTGKQTVDTNFGQNSLAIGGGAVTFGSSSIALGGNTGNANFYNLGKYSLAIDNGANARGQGSIAIGGGSNAYGMDSIAIGGGAQTGNLKLDSATGKYTVDTSFGTGSIAIGGGAMACGQNSLAIGGITGINSKSGTGAYSISLGSGSCSAGYSSFAIAQGVAYASNSIAFGSKATTGQYNSTTGVITDANNSIAISINGAEAVTRASDTFTLANKFNTTASGVCLEVGQINIGGYVMSNGGKRSIGIGSGYISALDSIGVGNNIIYNNYTAVGLDYQTKNIVATGWGNTIQSYGSTSYSLSRSVIIGIDNHIEPNKTYNNHLIKSMSVFGTYNYVNSSDSCVIGSYNVVGIHSSASKKVNKGTLTMGIGCQGGMAPITVGFGYNPNSNVKLTSNYRVWKNEAESHTVGEIVLVDRIFTNDAAADTTCKAKLFKCKTAHSTVKYPWTESSYWEEYTPNTFMTIGLYNKGVMNFKGTGDVEVYGDLFVREKNTSYHSFKVATEKQLSNLFNTLISYSKGSFCVHLGTLYKAKEDIPMGAWDSSKWQSTKITDELGSSSATITDDVTGKNYKLVMHNGVLGVEEVS